MKTENLLLVAGVIGFLAYSLTKSKAPFSESFVCYSKDNKMFPWPTGSCPYADTVYSDVPYVYDMNNQLQPVVY